jgi:DNA mismatch repair protein MutS
MCGVPFHAVDGYIARLVRKGFRVAICDQVEDPASAQGLVRREVVRVVTPGTVTEEELLDPRRANHLVAVRPEGELVGLAWADLSTGAFQAADVPWERLADEMDRLAPRECLYAELDLELRGPGEFFGTKQAGMPGLRVANILRDRKMLELAKMEAVKIVERTDPEITDEDRKRVMEHLKQHWQRRYGLVEVG